MLKEGSPSKYFFLGMLALVAVVSIIIIYPFLTSILGGAILAYLFYPFYNWVQKKIRFRGVAAFITAVLIIIIVTVPAVLLVKNITTETHYLYIRTKQHLATGQIIDARCYEDTFLCRTVKSANELMRD